MLICDFVGVTSDTDRDLRLEVMLYVKYKSIILFEINQVRYAMIVQLFNFCCRYHLIL